MLEIKNRLGYINKVVSGPPREHRKVSSNNLIIFAVVIPNERLKLVLVWNGLNTKLKLY